MSLNDPEYENEHMVGSARRKSKYPRKILRVILSDGTCTLQTQLTPEENLRDEDEWGFYNHVNEDELPEVISDLDNYHHLSPRENSVPRENSESPTSNILTTHHASNELKSHQYNKTEHINNLRNHDNEHGEHTLKGLSDLRLSEPCYDTENTRYDAENSRYELENSRYDSENSRYDSENSRYDMENSRYDNENSRYDTENSRYDAENSRYDSENRYFERSESRMYTKNVENTVNGGKIKVNSTVHPGPGRPRESARPHKHQHPEPTPELPYQCDTCDMLFKTMDLLTDHQRTVHHNNRQFACRYCSKRFNDKYNMRKHVLIHVGEKRHRCQFCNKAFLRKDHLRSHLQTHYNRKFGCKICGKSFRTLDMYQRHAKTHKSSPSLVPPDPTSVSPYSNLVNYDNNGGVPEIQQNGDSASIKEDPEEVVNGENGDALHISNVKGQYGSDVPSPEGAKLESFPVTILDEDYNEVWGENPSVSENGVSARSSPISSSEHNHSFYNGDSPSAEVSGYTCKTCNASFKSELSLQFHSQNCGGDIQNWQCMKCNIVFDEAKTLKQHYEKVHSVEEPLRNPSRWRCKTCNINYPNSKELSRHYAQAHKDAQIFPCSECPKTFTVWHNLKKHMLIHLGDKKHKCNVCEKGFVRKDHLNSHMKVHLGDGSKFTCPICCKVFRLKQMYLKHMNLHGLEQAFDEKPFV